MAFLPSHQRQCDAFSCRICWKCLMQRCKRTCGTEARRHSGHINAGDGRHFARDQDNSVVFAVVTDPVGSGFVQSLPHPGGNATGFINIEASVGGKFIEILKEIAPRTLRATVMFNPKTAPQSSFYVKSLEAASALLALPLAVADVSSGEDIEAAITDLARMPILALSSRRTHSWHQKLSAK